MSSISVEQAVEREAVERVLARLDGCVWRLGQGQDVPAREIQQHINEVLVLASTCSPEDIARFSLRLEALTRATRAALEGMRDRLQSLGAGRRAVRGYTGRQVSRRLRGRP